MAVRHHDSLSAHILKHVDSSIDLSKTVSVLD